MNMITIRCDFVYLNEYINKERRNKYAAAKVKDDLTNEVAWQCKMARCTKPKGKVDMMFRWHVKGHHDSDNIAFAKKFVFKMIALSLYDIWQIIFTETCQKMT